MTGGGVCERGSEDLATAPSRADDRAGIIVESGLFGGALNGYNGQLDFDPKN